MVIETTKKTNVASPDSIPSMTDTSMGSSDNEFSPRQLFAKDERADSPYAFLNRCSSMVEDEVNTEVEYGSEVSITSSETTAVASWNRSHMATTLSTTNNEPSKDDMPNLETSQDSFLPRQSPTITIEDPLDESVTCHGPLTTRQMAELLGAFQSRAMGNPRSHSTPSTTERNHPPTPPPMTPREELLLRERAALKKIIQDDSVKIINLRSAMEAQRGMNTVKDIEIEDKEFELQIALDRIDALKKEKEVLREREDALMQTIQILKTEVDKLSKLESTNDGRTAGEAHDSFRTGNYHHQVSQDDEREYDVISTVANGPSDLPSSEHEDGQSHSSIKSPETNSNSEDRIESPELFALAAALEDITTRLDAVEKRQQDTELTILRALEQKNNSGTHETCDTELIQRHGSLTKDVFKVSQNPDEVEVVLVHDTKKKVEKSRSPPRDSLCCWDACSDALSDIF